MAMAPQAPDEGAPEQAEDAQQQGGGGGGAQAAIEQIQQGFQSLAKLMQGQGAQVDEQDMALFQDAIKSTDNFIQAMMSPAGGGGDQGAPPPGKPAASGPMPMNAAKGGAPKQAM